MLGRGRLRRTSPDGYGLVVVVVVVVDVVAIAVLFVDERLEDVVVVRLITHAMLPGGFAVIRANDLLYESPLNCTCAPVVELV
jgi:hypothetical protein